MVALRGTTSVEDIITDSVAEPQKLDPEWIPKCIRNEASGPLFAHAGIKAAADAVLKVWPSCAKNPQSINHFPHIMAHSLKDGRRSFGIPMRMLVLARFRSRPIGTMAMHATR